MDHSETVLTKFYKRLVFLPYGSGGSNAAKY